MDNPEYTFQILEVFSKVRGKEIPRELEEYISYVARTGDPVFQWSLVKVLIKEKLQAVLGEFVENGGPVDVPACPNVDLFDYDSMKEHVLKQLDAFVYPPFTIQRICELLAAPRKEYNRVDKYMRAIEKNVLVVSASDLSMKRALEADANESVINGILLYDKVNDSLTTFTNHVFAASASDELGKMDETDAVQRIIDESWEEPPAFKLNGSGAFELRQFGDKEGDEEAKTSSASSSSDESLETCPLEGSAAALPEGAFEAEESAEPASDCEFKEEGAGQPELEEAVESPKATPVLEDPAGEFEPEEPSTTTLELMVPEEAADERFDEAEAHEEEAAAEGSFEEYTPMARTAMDAAGWITYSAGDYEASVGRPDEDNRDGQDQPEDEENSKVAAEEPSQPRAAEAEVEPETTTAEVESSQSAE